MPTSLQGAEEAIKKHEDFLTTTEASEEKITGVVDAGRRLINDCNANSDKIQEKVDSIQERLAKVQNIRSSNSLVSLSSKIADEKHVLFAGI